MQTVIHNIELLHEDTPFITNDEQPINNTPIPIFEQVEVLFNNISDVIPTINSLDFINNNENLSIKNKHIIIEYINKNIQNYRYKTTFKNVLDIILTIANTNEHKETILTIIECNLIDCVDNNISDTSSIVRMIFSLHGFDERINVKLNY